VVSVCIVEVLRERLQLHAQRGFPLDLQLSLTCYFGVPESALSLSVFLDMSLFRRSDTALLGLAGSLRLRSPVQQNRG
jgi:hypothetical protein